jgi:hypothetical protein
MHVGGTYTDEYNTEHCALKVNVAVLTYFLLQQIHSDELMKVIFILIHNMLCY